VGTSPLSSIHHERIKIDEMREPNKAALTGGIRCTSRCVSARVPDVVFACPAEVEIATELQSRCAIVLEVARDEAAADAASIDSAARLKKARA
jgi:hypothetical protein